MDNSWHASVPFESRQKIVKRIGETLQRHMSVAELDGLDELLEIASRLEEENFQAATTLQDYLRKISLKMLSLETTAIGNYRPSPSQQQRGLELQHVLKPAKECLEAVEKMPARNFNNEQCDYLVDKLKVVVQSASSFSEVSRIPAHYSPLDHARHIGSFKLLLALANQIKSFVQGCCKDAWIQAATTLTNMAEHVSSIGYNLELCRVYFCEDRVETEILSLDEVVNITNAEVEIVKKKASADMETLLARVKSELSSLRGAKRSLANYILQRLPRVQVDQDSLASGPSLSGVEDEESFWKRFFKWVKPAERLGKGSAATVHKATWLGIPVAKKTFEGHENPDFVKEVGILGKLCHPNITSMFCCDKNNRSCAIIMELMDDDLHDLMRKRCNYSTRCPFPIFEAVDIMLQIGEGVNYLHSQKIVHRDLKSFNILVKIVKERGSKIEHVHAKVADFGLSKTKESSIRYSTQSFNTGTNRWMAPEIINLNVDGHASAVEPKYPFKCDVYSFAMVCYEILSGYEPFYEERSPRIIKEKVLKGGRPSLPNYCPPLLMALIEQCWIQEPKERPSFAFICSELKYLKYLLMIGVDGIPPTSGLAQSAGTIASASCTSSAMGQTLGHNCFSRGQIEGEPQGAQMNPQEMSVQQLNPEHIGAQQMNRPQQISGQQLNPRCAPDDLPTNGCTTYKPATNSSTDMVEEVPHTAGEGTGHTFESTRTETIVPKTKDVGDQSFQDDGTTSQDIATMFLNQEDEFETLVASGSANVSEREVEGIGEQESGGVNFRGRRTSRAREPFGSEHSDEFRPKKRSTV